MKTLSDAKTVFNEFYNMQQDWLAKPDGFQFNRLISKLYELIMVIVNEKLTQSYHTGTIAFNVRRESFELRLVKAKTGSYEVGMGSFRMELQEVVQEYVMELSEKFKKNKTFRIQNINYLTNGLMIKAFTMLRSMHRKLGIYDDQIEVEDHSGIKKETYHEVENGEVYHYLKLLWFHHINCRRCRKEWQRIPGFSLRHCYAAIRLQSGANALQVANELGIHSSRITRLRKEFSDFFPEFTNGGFIPLGDFAGINVSSQVLKQMGLANGDNRSLDRNSESKKALNWIQDRKTILWEVYIFSRTLLEAEQLTEKTVRIECPLTGKRRKADLQLSVIRSSLSGTRVVLNEINNL